MRKEKAIALVAAVLLTASVASSVQRVCAAGENWEIMRGIYLALYAVIGVVIIFLLIVIASLLREIKEYLRVKGVS